MRINLFDTSVGGCTKTAILVHHPLFIALTINHFSECYCKGFEGLGQGFLVLANSWYRTQLGVAPRSFYDVYFKKLTRSTRCGDSGA